MKIDSTEIVCCPARIALRHRNQMPVLNAPSQKVTTLAPEHQMIQHDLLQLCPETECCRVSDHPTLGVKFKPTTEESASRKSQCGQLLRAGRSPRFCTVINCSELAAVRDLALRRYAVRTITKFKGARSQARKELFGNTTTNPRRQRRHFFQTASSEPQTASRSAKNAQIRHMLMGASSGRCASGKDVDKKYFNSQRTHAPVQDKFLCHVLTRHFGTNLRQMHSLNRCVVLSIHSPIDCMHKWDKF